MDAGILSPNEAVRPLHSGLESSMESSNLHREEERICSVRISLLTSSGSFNDDLVRDVILFVDFLVHNDTKTRLRRCEHLSINRGLHVRTKYIAG